MARKKTEEELVDGVVNENVQAEAGVEKIEKVSDVAEIPEDVKVILEHFSNLDEVYVNKKGGVFSKNTAYELTDSAVLYTNPYFKK